MTRKPKPTRASIPIRKEFTKNAKANSAKTSRSFEFPIVGIGASAGGLEALDLFLANVRARSGNAYVIVQHLDPSYKGIMVELLQRVTPMPVVQVKDRTRVKADCVYVIPPNKDMSILHGVLHLLEPVERRGLRLPIDFFFRSLAEDRQEQAIGVILSGMGSDGTLGVRSIKEHGGVVFVQDPGTAKFSAMPGSAIEAGVADVVAPVEEIPGRIGSYFEHFLNRSSTVPKEESVNQSALEKVIIVLRAHTGHDFSLYKKSTIYRRIERRMRLHQISKIATFVRLLQENPQEVDLLFRELLIGVTNFFRDTDAWPYLKTRVLKPLLEKHGDSHTLRAWVPACATGEEAYSLAMLFREAVDEFLPGRNVNLQIFATDLDKFAIEKAREGMYPANIAADVSVERLDRFFIKSERGYQVSPSIRQMVIFAPQNLIMDPPFGKLDLLSCRNLLIYLTPELQKKMIPLFHHCLNPGGYLILGTADTIGSFTNLFSSLDRKIRLYQRRESTPKELIEFPTTFVASKSTLRSKSREPVVNLQAEADQLLLQHYSPPAVLTNHDGDILYTSGRTGIYLEPAAGRANWNIFVMAKEGLRTHLGSAFQKALRLQEPSQLNNIVVGSNGGKQRVNVSIIPLAQPPALQGMVMVIFTNIDSAHPASASKIPDADAVRVAELELELQYTRQDAQSSREEMQSSHEELTSANEELQSTNEELTSSTEELQSMNEEMHTVNAELQARLDELSRVNNDMKNLLDSTDIATLFLDNSLCVRRFTQETAKITRLIPTDVGRPITDIASGLLYTELAEDARQVLRSLMRIEKQICTPEGNWYTATMMPYRTLENMIDGLVITFADITSFKNMEAELRAENAHAKLPKKST